MTFNIAYEEEIKTATGQQKNPLMMEDDVLRLIFQRILGIGHLIYSMEDTGNKLAAELVSLE